MQYTIWPNGVVTYQTYLAISENWDVEPSEVVYFGQNQNEARGFDPKEHMQWHENYDVMQLADSSFYFVANKSLAKGEGDVVNVQLPPNSPTITFELANGTNVPSSGLQGDWLGDAPQIGGQKLTLTIPSITSTGKHEIYAMANGVKVGQLNVFVYGQKEKDVVIVPLVNNFNYTAAQIQTELEKTFGEANIDINVAIAPQWNDSVFTASTNIPLPIEVDLLNKYSDEMRELRDAYFDAHPNEPTDVYYLFVVNGFDDPSELGYMVRGRSMGFVKGSQSDLLNTIAHELGHGMGALEHSWKDNGPNKETTSNLYPPDQPHLAQLDHRCDLWLKNERYEFRRKDVCGGGSLDVFRRV